MNYSLGKIAFVLCSLLIFAVAYLPVVNINIIPACLLGNCKSITATSQVHVYGGPLRAQWDISQFSIAQELPVQKTYSLWYSTGQVCAVYRLYNSNHGQLQSGTVCNPNAMDWALAGSYWDSSFTFSGLSTGQYYVGVTFYEDNEARTNELVKGVTVT